MANNSSDNLRVRLINATLQFLSYTSPTNVYIAACTTTPTDADTGSTLVEPSGGSYARVNVPCGTSTWNTPTSLNSWTASNVFDVTFPTATGSWGTLTGFAICDSTSAGQVLYWGSLASSRTISSGDTFLFPSGQLTIQIT